MFYCVANMPGAVPRTSTYALTNATMPYVLKLADKGWQAACQADPALAKGLSTHEGALLSEQVAADLDLPYHRSGRAGLTFHTREPGRRARAAPGFAVTWGTSQQP